MMATLGPWLRRIFAPVHHGAAAVPPAIPADDATALADGSPETPDPITARLDEAIERHRQVFQNAADHRDRALKRLASTVDDCLHRNTFRTRADG